MFSIIIPTLNEEKFLPTLLDSLVGQTERNFDVTVVDGASEDGTIRVASSYRKKGLHIRVISSEKASLPYQRNLGARATKGEWLVFIDADSVVMPNFISRISEYVKKEHPEFFVTWMSPDSNNPKEANIALLANMLYEVATSMRRPLPSGPLTAVSRRAFEMIGGYDETHHYHEDVDLSMRLLKQGVAQHVIPETLFIWSLRRFRNQGTLKVMQQYALSAFPVLLFNRPLKYLPGYIMGGQLYGKKKPPILRVYEKRLRKFVHELFQ